MTDWSQLIAYKCATCNTDAIEPRDSDHAADLECRACHYTPQLEDAPERVDYEIPAFPSPRRSDSCGGTRVASSESAECRMGESPARRAAPRPEHSDQRERPRSGEGGARGSSITETQQTTLTDGGFRR
ncbi:hypothetical protein [Natrialba sp. SSL1]|uniref:hypothetical protein n=1 Tax=Natrialba sp. SSL1 TaxID=1869245 RepID=UPI001114685C|nr:hypothetical protein [Natrialba sp. SSL1]